MKRILIADAWPYVNGDLHIGHIAGHMLSADIFARFHRGKGHEVLMVSGSDCYGTPITVEADKRNVAPEVIVEEYHAKILRLIETYNFSYDIFTKTSTDNHKKVTQDMFVALAHNGYIFIDSSQQYFDDTTQKFLPDRYVEGTCGYCGYGNARSDQCDSCGRLLDPQHLQNPVSKLTKKPVVMKNTQHYYIDLPKLQPMLESFVAKRISSWRPWIGEETKGWLSRGLEPRAITRDLNWGIPIPTDRLPESLQIKDADSKRIYVWFDAVIGYLSASIEWGKEEKWRSFWYPADNQTEHWYFMGKDNLVFHTLFWPSQLYGYDKTIHLPDNYCINQYLTLEGQKFSKSRGITVDSYDIAQKYGADAVRWYLASIMPENADANFSWADFFRFYNDVLVATFSNFIHRVLSMVHVHGILGSTVTGDVKEKISVIRKQADAHISAIQMKLYVQDLLELASFGNKYIDTTAPWKLEKDKQKEALENGLAIVSALAQLSEPLAPAMSKKLQSMLMGGKPQPLFMTLQTIPTKD